MRIVYSGIFIAAEDVIPNTGGLLALGIFALLFLAVCISSFCQLLRYIRLKRHGLKVRARIVKREKRNYKRHHPYWNTTYIYRVGGVPYQCEVRLSSPYQKYSVRKTLDVRCDPENPYRHIIVPNTLWSCIGVLFLTGLLFCGFLVMFLCELRGSF